MKVKNIIKQIILIGEYSIEYVFAKQFILAGVQTEQELMDLLKAESKITMAMRLKIQNAYRDITITNIIDIDKIPVFS